MTASRGPGGPVRLDRFKGRGELQRSRPLADDVDSAAIVGVGDRGFAVATGGSHGAAVRRFAFDGATTKLWRSDAAAAPAIAWSKGQLVVTHARGEEVTSAAVALPR